MHNAINLIAILVALYLISRIATVAGWYTLLIVPLVLIFVILLSGLIGLLAVRIIACFDEGIEKRLQDMYTVFGSS